MKTMTCRQLGGACDKEFYADTFEGMAELSRMHGAEMKKQGDPEHLEAMKRMRELMKDPESMKEWMEARGKDFNALPEDK
jgi:hypothetical protein